LIRGKKPKPDRPRNPTKTLVKAGRQDPLTLGQGKGHGGRLYVKSGKGKRGRTWGDGDPLL